MTATQPNNDNSQQALQQPVSLTSASQSNNSRPTYQQASNLPTASQFNNSQGSLATYQHTIDEARTFKDRTALS